MAIVPAAQLAAAKRVQSARPLNFLQGHGSDAAQIVKPKPAPIFLQSHGSDAAQGLIPGTSVTPAGTPLTGTVTQPQTKSYADTIEEILAGMGLGNVTTPANAYQGQVTDQPDYQSGLELFNDTNSAAAQAKALATKRALVAAGIVPNTSKIATALQPFMGDIDPAAITEAGSNEFSTQAQLQRGLNQATAGLPYQLAARGMQSSGEAAQRGQQLNDAYDLQSNNNLSSLLSTLQGYGGDYGTAIAGARSQWDQAQRDIAMRLAQTQGYSEQTANPDWAAIIRALTSTQETPPGAPPPSGIQPTPQRPYVPPTPTPAQMKALSKPSSALTRAKAAASLGYIGVPVSSITAAKKKGK